MAQSDYCATFTTLTTRLRLNLLDQLLATGAFFAAAPQRLFDVRQEHDLSVPRFSAPSRLVVKAD